MLFIGKAVCDLKQQSNQDEPEATLQNRRVKELAQRGSKLRAFAAVLLTLASCVPQSGLAQQSGAGSNGPDKAASELPPAPMPNVTQQNLLHPSDRDFTKPFGSWLRNPINVYTPTTIDKASFVNSVRLNDLVKDGKIYLSLSDAIALAIENNYDIAIARYDLDIADTDILRTRTGAAPLGAPTAIVSNTLTGSSSDCSNRWRRTRRNGGRRRRRGFWRVRLDADHALARARTRELRSIRHWHHPVRARQAAPGKYPLFRRPKVAHHEY